jgi:hypothetical protein
MRCSAGFRWQGQSRRCFEHAPRALDHLHGIAHEGAARSQSNLTADKPPSLTILGVYSFSADKAAYAGSIRELIDSHDPPNFSAEVKSLLRKAGRGDEIVPLADEDRRAWEDNLRRYMDDAAVLEVRVANPDARFNPHDFAQIDPSNPKDHTEMAWNETFLTAGGETVTIPTTDKGCLRRNSIAWCSSSIDGSLASHCSPATESCVLRPYSH